MPPRSKTPEQQGTLFTVSPRGKVFETPEVQPDDGPAVSIIERLTGLLEVIRIHEAIAINKHVEKQSKASDKSGFKKQREALDERAFAFFLRASGYDQTQDVVSKDEDPEYIKFSEGLSSVVSGFWFSRRFVKNPDPNNGNRRGLTPREKKQYINGPMMVFENGSQHVATYLPEVVLPSRPSHAESLSDIFGSLGFYPLTDRELTRTLILENYSADGSIDVAAQLLEVVNFQLKKAPNTASGIARARAAAISIAHEILDTVEHSRRQIVKLQELERLLKGDNIVSYHQSLAEALVENMPAAIPLVEFIDIDELAKNGEIVPRKLGKRTIKPPSVLVAIRGQGDSALGKNKTIISQYDQPISERKRNFTEWLKASMGTLTVADAHENIDRAIAAYEKRHLYSLGLVDSVLKSKASAAPIKAAREALNVRLDKNAVA